MPIVEVDKLTKRYRGAETNAVDGVSFALEPGEFFALLGPNGAGKTTIISILTTTFSGGMHRKLEIIRSLMHRPRVLFLDEPTLGLDPMSRRSLWQYVGTFLFVRRERNR